MNYTALSVGLSAAAEMGIMAPLLLSALIIYILRRSTMTTDFNFASDGLEVYDSDKELEASIGIWLHFPNGRKINILRAGGSNYAYQRALSAATRPLQRQILRGTLDTEQFNQLLLDVYLKSVVIGWEGVKDSAGHEIPYSKAAAKAFFERFPEIFDEVRDQAEKLANFQVDQASEVAEHMGES